MCVCGECLVCGAGVACKGFGMEERAGAASGVKETENRVKWGKE